MKFFLPILAGASLVAAIDKAQSQASVNVILQAVANITNSTNFLTAAVVNFTNAAQAVTLLGASNGLLETIDAGTDAILNTTGIRGVDALQLTQPILDLRTQVGNTVQTVIDKRPTFVNTTGGGLNLGSIVLGSLYDQKCASQRFTNATKSRLPAGGLHAVADNLAAPIFVNLDRGIAAYIDQAANNSKPKTCDVVDSTSIDGPEGAAASLSANHLGLLVAVGLAVVLVV